MSSSPGLRVASRSLSTLATASNSPLTGPAVRLLLLHYGIKDGDVRKSGPKNNILKSDVLNLITTSKLKPVAQPEKTSSPSAIPKSVSVRGVEEKFTDIPLTNIRATIAKRLTQSKKTIPHSYASIRIEADGILDIQRRLKDERDQVISINDFIVKAAALALRAVPAINVQWVDGATRRLPTVDVSVAVATPSGLITPIVFDADALGVLEISSKIRELAKRARQNQLQPKEFQGGSFTISNLGMFGSVTAFTAIINPPQAAILAVGGSQLEVTDDLRTVNRFVSTLCFDGRAIEERDAQTFLHHLSASLSQPELLLAEPLSDPLRFDISRLL